MKDNQNKCPSPDVSAYVDGELTPACELALEAHMAACKLCRDELNLQKGMLNALNASLDDEVDLPLPADFTKVIVTNAESGVNGLRRPGEFRKAFFISATLIALSLVAMGSKTESTFAGLSIGVEKVLLVVVSALHFAYDLSLGSTVVMRSLASNFVFGSATAVVLVLIVFALSLYSFSRLLQRSDRR